MLMKLNMFIGSLIDQTEAIGLLTGEIDTYLDPRTNPIPNPCLRVLIDILESFSLSNFLNNKPLISSPMSILTLYSFLGDLGLTGQTKYSSAQTKCFGCLLKFTESISAQTETFSP